MFQVGYMSITNRKVNLNWITYTKRTLVIFKFHFFLNIYYLEQDK